MLFLTVEQHFLMHYTNKFFFYLVVRFHVSVLCVVSAEIRNGNLKSILGLFFILSRYKQQQQQQQQYYQSLVELSQQTTPSSSSSSPQSSLKSQDMQTSR